MAKKSAPKSSKLVEKIDTPPLEPVENGPVEPGEGHQPGEGVAIGGVEGAPAAHFLGLPGLDERGGLGGIIEDLQGVVKEVSEAVTAVYDFVTARARLREWRRQALAGVEQKYQETMNELIGYESRGEPVPADRQDLMALLPQPPEPEKNASA